MQTCCTRLIIFRAMKSSSISDQILRLVKDRAYRPLELPALAEHLEVPDGQYDDFQAQAEALHRQGKIIITEVHTVLPPGMRGQTIGTYRANTRGFGFVIPTSTTTHGDLYIPVGHQKNAITGDTVLARVLKKGKRGDRMVYEGRIVRILERGRSQFVGQLQKKGRRWFIEPEGKESHGPILVPDAKAKNAAEGMQVVVEITEYPSARTEARGTIVEVLGRHGDPGVDTSSMIRQYDLPHDFSKRCRNQARRVAGEACPTRCAGAYDADHAGDGRIDLSRKTIVTIDPDNARDFDDAISLKHKKGEWELGVHIADVSHFVKPGSALDDEAKERGNSVYFPGHVIPMLPETLSNGVCSLQEGVPRLCKSAFIRYDSDGRVLDERVCNSVICSTRRLTYEQASLILDGRVGGFNRAVVNLVREMDGLARAIQKRRLTEGMLVLDLPSVELVLDNDGAVVDVVPEDQSFSHTIIEMFMVEANEAVARLLRGAKTPYLRRIHPDPDRHSGEAAAGILNGLGYDMDAHPGRFAIQQALKQVKGRPEALPVNLAVLRSMQRAEYSPKQIGHYALASECYTHFTSPIRRYPDLTIHRLLDRYIHGELTDDHHDSDVPGAHTLSQLGTHCSSTERRAEAAERELRTVKVLRFLNDRVGDTLKGVITGVTDFGLFVQLDKYGIEGLVHREDLPDDWWTVLPESGSLVGEKTGQRFSIGDSAEVTIVRIDVPSRNLDLHLDRRTSRAGRAMRKTSRRGNRPAAKPRRKAKSGNTRQRRRRTR